MPITSFGLTGAGNIDRLAKEAVRFGADIAVTADAARYDDLRQALSGTGVEAAAGQAAIDELAARPTDWTMSAIVGAAGLKPGLISLEHGGTLALANKESLVAAGEVLLQTRDRFGAQILPVDSEHSAVFQALIGEDIRAVERVILTGSGGAFRDWPTEDLAKATPQQAATHPNWDMGQRITIDSATMFNKALELIEAKEFFGLSEPQIEAVIHPESLIHAMVGFNDGGLISHIGPPDMRHAIGFALHYPTRRPLPVARLDFAQIGAMTFRAACEARYPALRLAREVMRQGGLWGAALNAAKEIALDRFIACDIGFLQMAELVESTLNTLDGQNALHSGAMTLDAVLTVDHMARNIARHTNVG